MAINEILGFTTQEPQGSFTVCQYCKQCRYGREDSNSESDPETEFEESYQNSSGESSEEDRHRRHWHGGGGCRYELAATCTGRCNGIIPTCGACTENPSTGRPG